MAFLSNSSHTLRVKAILKYDHLMCVFCVCVCLKSGGGVELKVGSGNK